MKLEEFFGNRINIAAIARETGFSRGHLNRVVLGKSRIGKRLAKALEETTKGKLNAEELLKNNKEQKK